MRFGRSDDLAALRDDIRPRIYKLLNRGSDALVPRCLNLPYGEKRKPVARKVATFFANSGGAKLDREIGATNLLKQGQVHAMKRSRACDDLVALAAEASTRNSDSECSQRVAVDDWTPFVEGPAHRFKRSRAAVDSPSSSSDEADEKERHDRHALQFMLEVNNRECLSSEVTLRPSSAPSRSSVLDDDSLPLRRNSREKMLLRKKKQRVVDITNRFNDFGIHDEDLNIATRTKLHFPTPLVAKPQPVVIIETPETPEPRILRGLCFPREARCIDPLDKRQAQPFDMSAFIMLSISPER
ncbi:uncharacterized protein PITG_08722 [Phytophthora infestans T30-4]|uniref:Uncharacterized protein n=2 Tax=Phytophthora infestans TaxID=4787 RepID=D0ND18_PHYIT|nr:uncharacterized protein PITG_08722 [Phytophthora infestans T30-4]EEY55975.1 conserved hypothetical protein [Phytophthora infestans T30-4]|eukprot:XP_002902805.1 conserved hypothetical protein [Phytophthora infestans T30-4]